MVSRDGRSGPSIGDVPEPLGSRHQQINPGASCFTLSVCAALSSVKEALSNDVAVRGDDAKSNVIGCMDSVRSGGPVGVCAVEQ